jgi:hypothetical protein
MKKSKDDEIENKKSFNKLFQIKQIIIKRIETKPKKKNKLKACFENLEGHI